MRLKDIGQYPWLGAALLGAAVFAITLGGTYIYDDHAIILEDPRIANPARWGEFITQPYNDGVDLLYRPLVSMTYAIQWWIHGDRPWAFHLVNLLLHAGVSALVAALATRLLGRTGGWIAGALFAVHPVHVEAVANIVGRAELLSAAGMLGAMLLILEPLTRARALAIAGCFLVSLLSKEQGLLVPPLLAALWLVRGSAQRQGDSKDGVLMLVMLAAWLLAGYIAWREAMIGFWWDRQWLDWTVNPMATGRMNPHGGSIGADRWLMPLALLGRYAVLLFAPVRLLFDYGGVIIGWHVETTDPYLWIGIAAVLGWCILIGWAWRNGNRVAMFLAIALAMTYVMVGNVIALIGVNFAERLMYIPSAFFILLMTMLLIRLPRRAMIGVTVLLTCLGAARSFSYAIQWNDELHFYEAMLRQQPKSIRLHMLLVDTHLKAGRLDEAQRMAAQGRELLGEYSQIWRLSGVVALEQNKFDEAEMYLSRSFQLDPDPHTQAWMRELRLRQAATQRSQ